MRELASHEDVLAALRAVLADHTNPHFIHAFRYVADRGYGKPIAHVDITSERQSISDVLKAARVRASQLREVPVS